MSTVDKVDNTHPRGARNHAAALVIRLSQVRLKQRVAVAAGAEEIVEAEGLLKAGEIDGFVCYLDTEGGVIVQRHTQDERLAVLLDRGVAIAAADVGTYALDLRTSEVAS